jgi:hypothetical protein
LWETSNPKVHRWQTRQSRPLVPAGEAPWAALRGDNDGHDDDVVVDDDDVVVAAAAVLGV